MKAPAWQDGREYIKQEGHRFGRSAAHSSKWRGQTGPFSIASSVFPVASSCTISPLYLLL